MSNRFQTFSYVTASTNSGSSNQTNQSIVASLANVVSVSVTSSLNGPFDFKIFKKNTYLDVDKLAWWENVQPALYYPQDNDTGGAGLEGFPIPYDDSDGSGQMHIQVTNNHTMAQTFTVTVEWEEVPLFDASGNATFRAKVSAGTVFDAVTGYRIGGAAASGHYLRGNGTNYVDGTIQAGDLPGSGQITLNAGTNTGYTAPGTMSLGSTYTFGATTDNLRFNGLGLGVAAPTSGGQIAATLGANNITAVLIKRNTDSAPTGNFVDFQNAAAGSLFKIDITGTVTAGIWTGTAIANANLANSAVTVTAGTGLSGGGSVALGASVTLNLATPVSLANGGTNASLAASNGGIVYSGASAFAVLAGTATANKILYSGASTTPSWSTPTFPVTASATSGKIIQSDGTNWVASGQTFPSSAPATGTPLLSDGTNWVSTGTVKTASLGSGSATSGTFLRGDQTWASLSASPVGTYTAQAVGFTASSNAAYWITAASVTVTLPASPADGDYVIVADGASVTAGTTVIGRNGKTIMGLSADMTIDTPSFQVTLIYRSATTDWRLAA